MPSESWYHLTAILSGSVPELCAEDTGAWLFEHMRDAFPSAIAALLMPDHPHILLRTSDPRGCERRLGRMLGQLGRRFGVLGQTCVSVSTKPIRSGLELGRQVRYVVLNPCRAGLVRCPLAWPWTTHRDVVGAIVDPWVTADRLASALASPRRGFAERHHGYVSADPHADVGGTPFPVPALPQRMPTVPLRTIAEAVAAALRVSVASVQSRGPARALFVALAVEQGWNHAAKLAEICGVQARAIAGLAHSVGAAELAPARLCLGDHRLRSLPAKRRHVTSRSA
jgi:hypothetical protein